MRVRRLDGPTIIGIGLVLLGAVWLAARFVNIDLSQVPWPFYIIVPGVAIFLLSLAARDRGGEGLAIAGSVVTMVGLINLYQDLTGHFESWAYAWALVAPGGVGLGLLLFGLLARRPRLVVNGGRTLLFGLGLFLAGAVFFELILNIGGDHFGQTGRIALSAAVVLAGLLWLALSLRPFRR
jgi:hypothetical protein